MKTIAKNVLLTILVAVLIISAAVAIVVALPSNTASAGTTVSGEGDTFLMTDVNKDADKAFVYSATANFKSGDAAALVFGKTDDGCFVFNVDRANNAVKLMYFDAQQQAHVLAEEHYVGTNLMNDGEQRYVKSRTSQIDKVYLKVAVIPDGDKAIVECYADGIKRFVYKDASKPAEDLDLNSFTYDVKVGVDEEEQDIIEQRTLTYSGGLLGYNCFRAEVEFTDVIIGDTDYSNYTELYRNQYHFSQFAHWNNDPNGLVYYNGYYHLYFQHNPYGNTWDDMHWGHARSTDLVHWEMLPIALVPDYDLPESVPEEEKLLGKMWSGCARVYHLGDSATIDDYNWFDTTDKNVGDALGLIGYYTWWCGDNRYQILMYSTDGGLSWHKRNNIPCETSLGLDGQPVRNGSWRDPKVFDISSIPGIADGYKWGMALTDMERNTLFFLKSKDLVAWEHAGSYEVYRPECPDVVFMNDGENVRTLITFTSRYYIVCDLSYEEGHIVMRDSGGNKIESLMQDDEHLRKMEYAVDSYAAQTFYIDANSDSAYKGQSVAMSWFSGVPDVPQSIESGSLASARKVWNGGGMTIPVVYGLQGETLVTKPITVDDANFAQLKTQLVNVSNQALTGDELATVNGHCLEIIAKLSNPQREAVSIKVNISADGKYYTEIGWNATDGYFVDRTHTEDANIDFRGTIYAAKYASGLGTENTELDFYVLLDNNNVEVYCDGYTIPFYILTFASPYSTGIDLAAQGDVTITQLSVNSIGTVWRTESTEKMIYVSETDVKLDTHFCTEKEILAVAEDQLVWKIVSGENVVSVIPTATGATLQAKGSGSAVVQVSCGAIVRTINVDVCSPSVVADLTLKKENVVSGNWYYSSTGLVGEQPGGDGFILAEETASDFLYAAQFDLGSGVAAALVFRATEEGGSLKSYLIANYDNNGKIVKLWSENGELAKVPVTVEDTSKITLCVYAEGRNIKVYLNGAQVIDAQIKQEDALEGHFGLNVCATKAVFSNVKKASLVTTYSGEDLSVDLCLSQRVNSVVNVTLGNARVNPQYLSVSGQKLVIDRNYFTTLSQAGEYRFVVNGEKLSFAVSVNIQELPSPLLYDVTTTQGNNVVVFVGSMKIDSVYVNGNVIDATKYSIKDNLLTIDASVLELGDNLVELSTGAEFTVQVEQVLSEKTEQPQEKKSNKGLIIGLSVGGGVLVLGGVAVLVVLLLLKKRKNASAAEAPAQDEAEQRAPEVQPVEQAEEPKATPKTKKNNKK